MAPILDELFPIIVNRLVDGSRVLVASFRSNVNMEVLNFTVDVTDSAVPQKLLAFICVYQIIIEIKVKQISAKEPEIVIW